MTNNYTQSLAQEYLDIIDNIKSGLFSSEEIHQMESDRSVLHRQLEDAIGKPVPKHDMPRYARGLILGY